MALLGAILFLIVAVKTGPANLGRIFALLFLANNLGRAARFGGTGSDPVPNLSFSTPPVFRALQVGLDKP